MSANTKISTQINSQVPFYIRNDHRTFVSFLEAYYEYLEQNGKFVREAKMLPDYMDIDTTTSDFAQYLYDEFLSGLPSSTLADKALILKNAKDFFRSKGSEKSVRFLMRAIFNEEVEFYYPKKDVLRASDGKWYIQKSLRVNATKVNNVANTDISALELYVGRKITGNTSGASAIIEKVDRFYESGVQIDELTLSYIRGEFEDTETIFTYTGADTVTSNVYGGFISSIVIHDGGSRYNVGDPVIFISSFGSGACAVVGKVSTGNLKSISVLTGGAGYQANDYLLISGGGGTGANAQLLSVSTTGSVHPNTYNIGITTLADLANTYISNSSPYESQSYINLNYISTNTSNLTVSTGSGASVTVVNLSAWKANSNVFFETNDTLNVNSNLVRVANSNTRTAQITVSPGLPGNLVATSFEVMKRPNVNSIIGNTLNVFTYSNTGPASSVLVNNPGDGFESTPSITVLANSRIQYLGIVGRLEIIDGGLGYQTNDKIQILNQYGSYGIGAQGNVTNVAANGKIQVVQLEAMGTQYPVGGFGYDPNLLPTCNVVTGTGNGANIQVTALLGYGATFAPVSSTIGTIERIIIIDGGVGYNTAPTLNLSGYGDGTANAEATVVQGVYAYPGRYLNDDGHLSSYNFLQNRDYYQNSSYVIRVKESIDAYAKVLKDLVHPSGMKMFGEYVLNEVIDAPVTIESNTTVTLA